MTNRRKKARSSLAYCWRGGQIGFGTQLPDGALKIASGPAVKLRKEVGVNARLAYDNKTLLVPGVPEGQSSHAKLEAVRRFSDLLASRLIGAKVNPETFRWVCEYCFDTYPQMVLPIGWDFVMQAAICPCCQPKVERGGGIFVVRGGAFAGKRKDPRIWKEGR